MDSISGHEFEQTPGDSEGEGSLACCRPWGCRESDMTWELNNNSMENVPSSGLCDMGSLPKLLLLPLCFAPRMELVFNFHQNSMLAF